MERTKTQHSKVVRFSPIQSSSAGAYSRVHVYFDGSFVGELVRPEQGRGWSCCGQLNARYGRGFCEERPLDEAKRLVERAILEGVSRAARQ